MSIAAWPSIEPATARSACSRAASRMRPLIHSRNASATITIMIGPPTNSASVNRQPIKRARMMPSSTTRLVEAISKAMAALKDAPLRNSDRASATAAYEQDEEAAPRPVAQARERGESPARNRVTWSRRTTGCTTPDRKKPRISGQRISHPIAPAIRSASPMAPKLSATCVLRFASTSALMVIYPLGVPGTVVDKERRNNVALLTRVASLLSPVPQVARTGRPPVGHAGPMAGRHGVPPKERKGHSRQASRQRRRRTQRRDALQPWRLWLALRGVLALVVLAACGWSGLLLTRHQGGSWPVVAI